MDNDLLINEARQLYAALHVEQYARSTSDKAKFERLDSLVMSAYSRYQRRLNRCVICYQYRLHDCSRVQETKKRRRCPMLIKQSHLSKAKATDLIKYPSECSA
ncbi:MAG: hypothetical protein ACU83N_12625 [Gammaproteobacteria bacterium]